MSIYFSIHSPLAGRDNTCCHVWLVAGFSIHSPLAGRDFTGVKASILAFKFSIHSPLAERDGTRATYDARLVVFQSTRPLRSETAWQQRRRHAGGFSIHSPLAERDSARRRKWTRIMCFQSTRPLRSETKCQLRFFVPCNVFNPLAPCGARRFSKRCPIVLTGFQSTRPLRGETIDSLDAMEYAYFSIHSPLAGRDGRQRG